MAPKIKYKPDAYQRRLTKAKEYQKLVWHKNYVRREYGITVEDYETMLKIQNNKCAICEGPPLKQMFCIDHCHKTGKIRGLLCHKCNSGLGLFNDSSSTLRSAFQYLVNHMQAE
jgi:hypothetical protein